MSFFYTLEMQAQAEPLDVLQLLSEHLPFEWEDFRSPSPPHERKRLSGGQAVIYARSPVEIAQDVRTRFGFDSRLSVSLEIYGRSEQLHYQSVRTVIRCICVLLEHLQGDAVVLEYGETLLLQRLSGQLILNAVPFRFPEYQQALDLISLPYEMQELPYPNFKT